MIFQLLFLKVGEKMLEESITKLAGVGEKRAQALADLGIETIEDLLRYYPFRYDDIKERDLIEINDQEKVTIKGVVVSPPVINRFGYKKSRLQFRMMQDHDVFSVSFLTNLT
ncbi:ATP-dependent DNA helicase [Tetragenococcus muriaticus 3MR10-3]|uniref:ATP-dependent DNA helicase n=1 Tax=Tetragenococcus muriaticus 3MR10-3 TaxID=1302648 RepID=A0A091BYQ1_9ENTE|nr:ATP-dependent DNA helicase [Tetragenococcus muriaticus 3MR10-3]